MDLLIALIPILTLLLFLVIFEKPAYISGPIAFVVTIFLAIFYLKMDSAWLGASVIRGFMLSIDIMLILAGVFLLVTVLKKSNAFHVLRLLTHRISSDARVQIIFLGWFVIAFLEGVAGFGTPPIVVVPILVALGFSPLAAVVATLIGDSIVCTFGAAGTPMLIGIGQSLSSLQIEILGPAFLEKVTVLTSLFHLVLGSFIPLFILCAVTYIQDKSIKRALSSWKLALLSGILLLVPSFFINYLLGPEFPSILGSIIGMIIFVFLVKKKVFLPKDKWVIEKDQEFLAKLDRNEKEIDLDYERALFPYIVAVGLLILSRMNVWEIGDLLKTIKIAPMEIFGTSVGYSLYPFYSPGFFFMIAALIAFYIYRMSDRSAETVVKSASKKLMKTFLSLVSILSLVQILIYSANNMSGHSGMIAEISNLFTASGSLWPFFSPILGVFGAFIAGSSTVSNIIFSSVQVDTALVVGMSPFLVLALQSVGSAVGNMFAVHNVIAASAIVHMTHPEGKIIKYTIFPALIIAIFAGIIGLIMNY